MAGRRRARRQLGCGSRTIGRGGGDDQHAGSLAAECGGLAAESGSPVQHLAGARPRQVPREIRAKGIRPIIARRGVDHGAGLGVHQWVVEQTLALLHWFRRLRIRWEIRDDIHETFLSLGCSIIRWRRLQRHQSLH
ncbi:hypothetical protein FXN61_08880 [Lentzea sp. PSKA42]|uniref:Transposase DDE domain-containing protein n=1 Tax=Lentzea indica TaxID=2604800 RepID=A0ABX1FDT1_9PSEU|nr:hypothetical protein [Lentzea indica]